MSVLLLAWIYNDLGAANENFHLRNLVNALGVAAFNAGSIIAITGSSSLNDRGCIWLVILAATICSTISILDMADIVGDSARGRRTMPIVYGHEIARWGLAAPIMAWSVACPVFLGIGILGFAVSVVLGFGLFFGASDRKEAETDFVRRWRDEFAREEFVAGQRDVEAGENESGTVRRSELGMETIPQPASVTESRNDGEDSSSEAVRAPTLLSYSG